MVDSLDRRYRANGVFSVRVCALGLFLVGCGGASVQAGTSRVEGTPAPAHAAKANAVEAEQLPPAPEPVPAPTGVVVRARVVAPLLVADRVLVAAGLPIRAEDFLDTLSQGGQVPFGLPLDLLDLSGAFEAVVALEPGERVDRAPRMVVSAGVNSRRAALDALRKAGVEVIEGPNQAWYFSHERAHCALARALGPSPYRVACSDTSEGLSSLSAYAFAGLPAETRSGQVGWFDVDFRPIRQKYGSRARGLKLLASVGARQLHRDNPRFDRAVTDGALALAEELGDLLADADHWHGEFTQTERGDVHLRFNLELNQVTSWLALTLNDLLSAKRPAPPEFWALPSSVSAASYAVGVPSERMAKFRAIAVDLAAGALESKGAPSALIRDVEVALEQGFIPEPLAVTATGPVGLQPNGEPVPSWGLYGISRSRESLVKWLDAVSRALGSTYWKTLDERFDRPLILKKMQERVLGAPTAVLYKYDISKSLLDELEKLESSRARKRKGAKPLSSELTLQGYIAVDSLGPLTALVYARDKAGISAAFRDLTEVKGASLSSVLDLKGSFGEPSAAAGFMDVRALVGMYSLFLPDEVMAKVVKLLVSTPNGGQARLQFAANGATKAGRLSFGVDYDVSAAFIGDFSSFLGLLAAEFKEERAGTF